MWTVQPSFSAGEISPALAARWDVSKYHQACKTMENFYALPYGGAQFRSGTLFAGKAPGSGRLIPFEYSVESAFALEFTDQQIRVFRDGGPVLRDLVGAYSWSASGSGTNEYYAVVTGSDVLLEPMELYIDDEQAAAGTIGALAAGEWAYGDNDTLGYSTIYVRLPDGADPDAKAAGFVQAPWSLYVPYVLADLANIRYAQDAETLYLVHPSYPVRTVSVNSSGNWSTAVLEFGWAGDYILADDLSGTYTVAPGGTTTTLGYVVVPVGEDGVEGPPSSSINVTTDLAWPAGARVHLVFNNPDNVDNASWALSTLGSNNYYLSVLPIADPVNWFNGGKPKAVYYYTAAGTRAIELTESSTAPVALNQWYWGMEDGEPRDSLYVNVGGAVSGAVIVAQYGVQSYRIYKNERGAWGLIGVTDRPEFLDDNIEPDYTSGISSQKDVFSAEDDYPGAIGIYQQRLVLGRTNDQPQTLFASSTGDATSFALHTPLQDDDSIEATLAASRVNEIRHIVPLDKLLVLTSGAEWAFGASGGALSPLDLGFNLQGYNGSSNLAPLTVGKSVLHVDRSGEAVRDLFYQFESDGYGGNDVSLLASHLFRGYDILDWTYQRYPTQLVWAVRSDGTLLSLTYVREQDVWAWARHTTSGEFVSVCAVPNGSADDETYVLVKRTIDGEDVYYTEKMATWTDTSELNDAVFLDSALQANSPGSTTISGLDHLEGETVYALVDGGVVKDKVVSGGQITNVYGADEAAVVTVGLPYEGTVVPMPIVADGGPMSGRRRSNRQVLISLYRSEGGKVGSRETRLRQIKQVSPSPELVTGVFPVHVEPIPDRDPDIIIRQDDPLPITVLAIQADLQVGDARS